MVSNDKKGRGKGKKRNGATRDLATNEQPITSGCFFFCFTDKRKRKIYMKKERIQNKR